MIIGQSRLYGLVDEVSIAAYGLYVDGWEDGDERNHLVGEEEKLELLGEKFDGKDGMGCVDADS